jgi:hypothetical protein
MSFMKYHTAMKLVNVTPHTIAIYDENGQELILTVPPSGVVARCEETTERVGSVFVEGREIPLVVKRYGRVTDLPEPKPDVRFIVSAIVMLQGAAEGRTDLACPGDLTRDAAGNVIGCKSLCVAKNEKEEFSTSPSKSEKEEFSTFSSKNDEGA